MTKEEINNLLIKFDNIIHANPSLTIGEQESIGGQLLSDAINKEILEELRRLGNNKNTYSGISQSG